MITKFAVYANYDNAGFDQNEIISIHSRYDLADRAAKGHTMRAICEVGGEAKRGDNRRELEIAKEGSI